MSKETGGPAFMVAELANIKHDGMDLRDYFAAKAMAAAMINPLLNKKSLDDIAVGAYRSADAMLKARKR